MTANTDREAPETGRCPEARRRFRFLWGISAALPILWLPALFFCAAAQAGSVNWIYSYEKALELAARENKPIMAGFYSTWCQWCRKLDTVTYADSEVAAISKDFVCLKVDVGKRRDIAYRYGVRTLPSILFLETTGRVIWREYGYREPAMLSGRMREVSSFFRKSAVSKPYIRSAFNEVSQGRPDRAISILDNAISLYNDDSHLYAARGVIYRYKQDFDNALRDIDRALSLDPGSDELYNMRGMIYHVKKETTAAMSDFDKAISINRWSYEAYNGRGVIYVERNEPDPAIKNFNTAVLINPRNPGAYFNRGVAYIYKGSLNKALDDLVMAIKLDPHPLNAYSARAGVYMKLGQYEKSWEDVYAVERLGYKMRPEFMAELRRLSGREE
jgi:tetratricopeptide (TPR) repeat protein